MKRCVFGGLLSLSLLLGVSVGSWSPLSASEHFQPAPTLIVPTPIPTVDTGIGDVLLSESGVARIQRDGVVRVGVLYNAAPFGELNLRGEPSGFDVDLARAIADLWGVELRLAQVTRQTAFELLANGDVDLLIAAQVHRRELDTRVEFSQTYTLGRQVMLVRNDDPAQAPTDFGQPGNPRRVGVVVLSAGETAYGDWVAKTDLQAEVTTYYTLDQAITELLGYQVDAIVGSQSQLRRAIAQPDLVRYLEPPLEQEPYAIVVRRQDAPLRGLVNRALQFLMNNGRLRELNEAYFPEFSFSSETLTVWANLGGEAPQPSQSSTEIRYPTEYAIPRIQANRVVRVAGIPDLSPALPESERRLIGYNRALVEEMAVRWGVEVQLVFSTGAAALEAVASGQADLAVGVLPDWAWADRVDFSEPYLLHGNRLLVRSDDNYENFSTLMARPVGIFASEPGVTDVVSALVESANSRVELVTLANESDAGFVLLTDNREERVDAVFGDSLKLLPHLQQNSETLRYATRCELCEPWYSRYYLTFAVAYNDLDMRLLVDYTLQAIVNDGRLAELSQPVMLPDEVLLFDIWPGADAYLGFVLSK